MKPSTTSKPLVLFLCTGNSARSQMAEAFLRKHAGSRFEVRSAGVEPTGIHPMTTKVMQEVGVSLEDHRSKSVQEFLGLVTPGHVIFVCDRAEQSCPTIWPRAIQSANMPFTDPAAGSGTEEERLDIFRQVREEIEQKIIAWINDQSQC